MLLIRWQSIHALPLQDAVHRGARDLEAMKPVQIRGDPGRSEVRMLAQVEDLADDLPSGRSGRALWRPRAIGQTGVTVLGVTPLPLIKRFARDAEPTAHSRDILLVRRLL